MAASPTSTACPVGSAMLPPAGTGFLGDTLVAGLVVMGMLPIAGLALFGPGTLLAAARRRRRLLMLLGLTLLSALTLSCASTEANPVPTPAALASPAASPSCAA